jgi:hypothetical protein
MTKIEIGKTYRFNMIYSGIHLVAERDKKIIFRYESIPNDVSYNLISYLCTLCNIESGKLYTVIGKVDNISHRSTGFIVIYLQRDSIRLS